MAAISHHRVLFALLTEPPDTRLLELGRYRVIRARPFYIATLKKG